IKPIRSVAMGPCPFMQSPLDVFFRHCEPTDPARSGRPDDRLREAIQFCDYIWIASSLCSSQ
ncbi:MAG: hypothetical protein ABSG76_26395, partial [Xanthobacteraceae bacterium]